MAKLILAGIALFALVSLVLRVLDSRAEGPPVSLELSLSQGSFQAGGRISGEVRYGAPAELHAVALHVELVGRRRHLIPTETEQAAMDYRHDPSDLYRAGQQLLSETQLPADEPRSVRFDLPVPPELPGPETRQTNTPGNGGAPIGSRTWEGVWRVEVRLDSAEGTWSESKAIELEG